MKLLKEIWELFFPAHSYTDVRAMWLDPQVIRHRISMTLIDYYYSYKIWRMVAAYGWFLLALHLIADWSK